MDGSWLDYLVSQYPRGCRVYQRTGADRHLRFQGIDFQNVHLVDGSSSGLGLGAGGIPDVEKTIASAIGTCKEISGDGGNVILVLDGLDFLLAATGCEVLELLDMIGEFGEVRLSLDLQPTCTC